MVTNDQSERIQSADSFSCFKSSQKKYAAQQISTRVSTRYIETHFKWPVVYAGADFDLSLSLS